MKLYNECIGILRASPVIITISSLISGLIFLKPFFIYFGLYIAICTKIISNIKKVFKNTIYKNIESIPLLGKGERPDNAKYCGHFITEDNLNGTSTSFGMPSGHSASAMIFCVFFIRYILEKSNINNNYKIFSISIVGFISFLIMWSRYYMNCHTIQHIIVGGSMGSIFGYIGFDLYTLLENNIKKILNNNKLSE